MRCGSVSGRPTLGVNCSKLSAMASNFYGLPEGLYLSMVDNDCGGHAAGLQAGDVITHINDIRVKTLSEGSTQGGRYRIVDGLSKRKNVRDECMPQRSAFGRQRLQFLKKTAMTKTVMAVFTMIIV